MDKFTHKKKGEVVIPLNWLKLKQRIILPVLKLFGVK
jgi:hypothetical protein